MWIAWAIWSATKNNETRSICARWRSATTIRSCCASGKNRACRRIGFKLASEEDLDRAASYFARKGLPTVVSGGALSGPHVAHGRCRRHAARLLCEHGPERTHAAQYAAYQGARIQRIDHINCFTPDVQASYDFYTEMGFRLTEYTETDDADPKLWAVWMHRKGNVHDLAFTNGAGRGCIISAYGRRARSTSCISAT